MRDLAEFLVAHSLGFWRYVGVFNVGNTSVRASAIADGRVMLPGLDFD